MTLTASLYELFLHYRFHWCVWLQGILVEEGRRKKGKGKRNFAFPWFGWDGKREYCLLTILSTSSFFLINHINNPPQIFSSTNNCMNNLPPNFYLCHIPSIIFFQIFTSLNNHTLHFIYKKSNFPMQTSHFHFPPSNCPCTKHALFSIK